MSFEPDWSVFGKATTAGPNQARAVITEYKNQLARAGLVMVRREDLETLLTYWGFFPLETLPQEIQLATTGLTDSLAATPASAPGGDKQ